MNDDNREIFMTNKDSPVEKYLSQILINKGFLTTGMYKSKLIKDPPLIFFSQNNQPSMSTYKKENDFQNIEQFLKKNNLTPNPIFIITTGTEINYFSRIDHLGAIVEIQINPNFYDVINSFEDVEDDKSLKFKCFKSAIDSISEIIVQYVKNPPNSDEYIIEEVPTPNMTPTIGVVGLGYVGLPVAVELAEKYRVIGFDINQSKIDSLQKGFDITGEISKKELEEVMIEFTTQEKKLKQCDYIIIVVPTPISSTKEPDLTYLKNASKIVGRNLSIGTTVIYESTVYPGTTEEVCIPILETYSHLTAGNDFLIGYSPERINPGDQEHTFKNNNKVVSGHNNPALERVYELYDSVLDSEVYKAPSIKVAEASKIVENTQRDINIALMNELAIIFDHLNIDTSEVLKAARTKWNFLPFTPGLVGGHCIGVDPYYLIYESKSKGYEPNFISSARHINDQMPHYIVQSLLKLIIRHKLNVTDLKVTVLGITFKENIPDLRNSKSLEIVEKLQELGVSVQVSDPMLSKHVFQNEKIDLREINQLDKAHVIIFAVPHQAFEYTREDFFNKLLIENQGIVMDIKGMIPSNSLQEHIIHWKL